MAWKYKIVSRPGRSPGYRVEMIISTPLGWEDSIGKYETVICQGPLDDSPRMKRDSVPVEEHELCSCCFLGYTHSVNHHRQEVEEGRKK